MLTHRPLGGDPRGVVPLDRRFLGGESIGSLFDRVLLRVPIVGRILELSSVSAFAHAAALLLSSGVRLTVALGVLVTILAIGVFLPMWEMASVMTKKG